MTRPSPCLIASVTIGFRSCDARLQLRQIISIFNGTVFSSLTTERRTLRLSVHGLSKPKPKHNMDTGLCEGDDLVRIVAVGLFWGPKSKKPSHLPYGQLP